MLATFERDLALLSEILEENPDPWFKKPSGWLKKPDFKRKGQEIAYVKNPDPSVVPGDGGAYAGYRLRYFLFDIDTKQLSYFKNSEPSCPESGNIDLSYIIDVQPSVVFDAPDNSIDLISADRIYTLVAETKPIMLKWAYAFRLFIKAATAAVQSRRPSVSAAAAVPAAMDAAERWLRYDVEYEEPGPLMLNVMGSVSRDKDGTIKNKWIIVTSFENRPDGGKGRSEQTGQITVKDYLVGVNGIDLTKIDFNDAMSTIIKASWPKTIHFLRDRMRVRDECLMEGWTFIIYTSLSKRRRRYIELRSDIINFRKPDPGGAASESRDSFIPISSISQIRPVIDQNLPVDQQFVLQCQCYPGASIELVNEDDEAVGKTLVNTLELCFSKLQQMNAWRSALATTANHATSTSVAHSIEMLPIETIPAIVLTTGANDGIMGVKSSFGGKFSLREFSLSEGYLRWRRHADPKATGLAAVKDRAIFLATSSGCALRTVRVNYDASQESLGFQYQMTLQTMEDTTWTTTTIGMNSESLLLQWLQAVKDTVANSPGAGAVYVPGREDVKQTVVRASSTGNGDDEDFVGYVGITGEHVTQGYLYKKTEYAAGSEKATEAAASGIEKYRKRWFVLIDFKLFFYKSPSDAAKQELAIGAIDLQSALEIREATEDGAPENSIEIVLSQTVVLLVAEDEDELVRWTDALTETLESRTMAPTRETAGDLDGRQIAKRIAQKKKSIVFEGELDMKSVNKLTSVVTWKKRYFVIANGAAAYFDKPEHYFDDDKDSLGEFALVSISSIESSLDHTCTPGCAFDIHAYVTRGGDSNGIRLFTFAVSSPELCKSWMDELCAANGQLVMKEIPETGRWVSEGNSDLLKRRDDAKRKGSLVYAKEATINKVQSAASSSAGGDDHNASGGGDDHQDPSIAEEEARAHLLALERRNAATVVRRPSNTSALNAGRGGAGVRGSTPGALHRDSEGDMEAKALAAIQLADEETAQAQPAIPQGHHVQVQMRKPNILAGGRGGAGRGGRGAGLTPRPETSSGEM